MVSPHQLLSLVLCIGASLAVQLKDSAASDPVSTVLQLITRLEETVTKEGNEEERAYSEFLAWCKDEQVTVEHQLKKDAADKQMLEAEVAKSMSRAANADASIQELSGTISSADENLKQAKVTRKRDRTDFEATQEDLMDTIDTLERAISILQRQTAKDPSLLQMQTKVTSKDVQGMLKVLNTVIDGAALSQTDRTKLVSLVQSRGGQADEDALDDADTDTDKDTMSFKSLKDERSQSILEMLEDMKDKASVELSEAQKSEMEGAHSFDMLKGALEDQMAADNKDLSRAKSVKLASAGIKASAEGDLAMEAKSIANAQEAINSVTQQCKRAKQDHTLSMNSRKGELSALRQAKELIQEDAKPASDRQYNNEEEDASFLQLQSRTMHSSVEVGTVVKKIARKLHSTLLSQLASRIGAVERFGASSGVDPFAKVKSLISGMLEKIKSEAAEEASHKEYCDSETAKTTDKKDDLSSRVDRKTASIDSAEAAAAKSKEQVGRMTQELADLIKEQSEMDKARSDEHAAYLQAKQEFEQGVEGISRAIRVLRDYYGSSDEDEGAASFMQTSEQEGEDMSDQDSDTDSQDASSKLPASHQKGNAQGILSVLETISSDFSKSLAESQVAEEESASQYKSMTTENSHTKVLYEQDIKYKTKEVGSFAKQISEWRNEKEGMQVELSAVEEYEMKLQEMCTKKPESYGERQSKRQAEIDGLKEALKVLETQVFIQSRTKSMLRRITLRSF